MERAKRRWKSLPTKIRKPVILVIGVLLIILAVVLSPLPGPGGIPIFLVAIAVLASEFEWAMRLRDIILAWVHQAGQWIRAHKLLGAILLICSLSAVIGLSYFLFTHFRSAP